MRGQTANRNYEGHTIFIGEELMLSQFLEMDLEKVKGIALLNGNESSHVAILAQAKKSQQLLNSKLVLKILKQTVLGF